MENFADYMLNEEDLIAKMEIEYYLSKKENLFFDKSVADDIGEPPFII